MNYRIYQDLAIVTLEGPDKTGLIRQLGYRANLQDHEAEEPILWANLRFDDPTGPFDLLVELEDFYKVVRSFAEDNGYRVDGPFVVSEPLWFGNYGRHVSICQHPYGWVLLP